uniref:Uncharacterized protein n=1 Tax=Oryza rufipogon TaxID=4529 RepID=A0A0E0N9S3_ORYRU
MSEQATAHLQRQETPPTPRSDAPTPRSTDTASSVRLRHPSHQQAAVCIAGPRARRVAVLPLCTTLCPATATASRHEQ